MYDFKQELIKAKKIRKGHFGTAYLTERNHVIKIGRFTEIEIEMMKEASDSGIGPKIYSIYVNYDDKDFDNQYKVSTVFGKVAMERIPGISLYPRRHKKIITEKISGNYFRQLKKLNYLGISHNDAHPGNTILNDEEIRLIDYGFSLKGWGFAFMESLRNADRGKKSDGVRFFLTDKYRNIFEKNFSKVIEELKSDGYSEKQIKKLNKSNPVNERTREKLENSDLNLHSKKFRKYITMMYEGI